MAAVRLVAYACLIASGSHAQVTRTPGKPPVVFLNGYQAGCSGTSTLADTFAQADEVIQRDGRVSLFFDNCSQARNAPIEEIGNAFGRYLEGLRYTDGTPVPEVDVIAHSMGGLIVRSYLAGKQVERGVFRPPAQVRIRKVVFLATPHFGSIATDLPLAPRDVQSEQLTRGSTFLFDLATWNQGTDDLRGIDAISVLGNNGTGVLPPLERRFDDSTVTLTSGSLEFALPDRTRVLPMCHTNLTGLLAAGCSAGPAIARWTADTHDAARITLSFLNGTSDWQSIGQDVKAADTRGGLFLQVRDASDRVVSIPSATNLNVRSNEIAWGDRLPAGTFQARAGTAEIATEIRSGRTSATAVFTGGPVIGAVLPSAAAVTPRAVAPGMFVSIYGSNLAGATEAAPGLPYPTSLANTQVLVGASPLQLHYAAPTQINAVIPADASGLLKLTVRSGTGERSTNVVVEPAVPTLFNAATDAVTGAVVTAAAPIARGRFVALYLTGLGATEPRGGLDWAVQQPSVTVGGQPCALQYAGRAPGYVGLDQINCQIAADAQTGSASPVSVTVGRRVGTSTLAILN